MLAFVPCCEFETASIIFLLSDTKRKRLLNTTWANCRIILYSSFHHAGMKITVSKLITGIGKEHILYNKSLRLLMFFR